MPTRGPGTVEPTLGMTPRVCWRAVWRYAGMRIAPDGNVCERRFGVRTDQASQSQVMVRLEVLAAPASFLRGMAGLLRRR